MPTNITDIMQQFASSLRKLLGNTLDSVIVYGSYARGDYSELSDIDVMILVTLTEEDVYKRQSQQKQLQAAIEVCTSIGRDKSERVDVDGYLSRMETMEQNGGLFARFMDDYKQVAMEEQERKFSFYTEFAVNTPRLFEKALRERCV